MHGRNRRWYDQKAELAKSVQVLEVFPDAIRTILAEGIITLAEREFEAHLLVSSLRSLGAERVLGIYKSKNKRRKLDSNFTLHKAMNYYFLLAPENRVIMAKLTLEMVDTVQQYLKTCRQLNQPADTREVASVTHAYIDSGSAGAITLLEQLEKDFRRKVYTVSLPNKSKAPYSPTLKEDSAGMQIREQP